MKIFLFNFFQKLSLLDLLPFRTFTRAFMIRQWINQKTTSPYKHIHHKKNILQNKHNNRSFNETITKVSNNKISFATLNEHNYKYIKYTLNNKSTNESILVYIVKKNDKNKASLIIQQIALISTNKSSIDNINITINNNQFIIKPYYKCTLIKTLCKSLYNKNTNFTFFQLDSCIFAFSKTPPLFNYFYYIFKNKNKYIISYY